jgi:hypothetical protein
MGNPSTHIPRQILVLPGLEGYDMPLATNEYGIMGRQHIDGNRRFCCGLDIFWKGVFLWIRRKIGCIGRCWSLRWSWGLRVLQVRPTSFPRLPTIILLLCGSSMKVIILTRR